MTNELRGKIEVTIGRVMFSGEGTQNWLAEQLDKVLESFSSHLVAPDEDVLSGANEELSEDRRSERSVIGSLPSYLKSKNAASNQVMRFLATAGWLAKKGNKNLKTGDIATALKESQQSRLGNPSDTLNQNVSKGFCEKTADGFFITPEGWEKLGDSL